jgi:hypothetical protein
MPSQLDPATGWPRIESREELARLLSGPASSVDHAPQDREEIRDPLDFVEDDEFSLLGGQIKFRLGQLGPVGRSLEIQINRGPCAGDLQRQGGFPDLPGSQQAHHRMASQKIGDFLMDHSFDHPCKSSIKRRICKD